VSLIVLGVRNEFVNYHHITLSLAGVFQGIHQVIRIVDSGYENESELEPLLHSLLKLEADDVIDIYGSVSHVERGLTLIRDQLQHGASGKSPVLGRYVATVLNLERQLSKQSGMLDVIAARITNIKRLTEHTNVLDETILKAIADLYTDTISNLNLRIQVVGNPERLKQPLIQNKIRSALFCSIRSAVLWRQLGGKRRQLIFQRKHLVSTANEILESINTPYTR
ncbi:MAG: high frequency lysogenization protein HflD, partial [Gammaproteobacteria bacterium]|nr:high frequency lysogenization protein HflD [Gammaproteobacteria bacterium]